MESDLGEETIETVTLAPTNTTAATKSSSSSSSSSSSERKTPHHALGEDFFILDEDVPRDETPTLSLPKSDPFLAEMDQLIQLIVQFRDLKTVKKKLEHAKLFAFRMDMLNQPKKDAFAKRLTIEPHTSTLYHFMQGWLDCFNSITNEGLLKPMSVATTTHRFHLSSLPPPPMQTRANTPLQIESKVVSVKHERGTHSTHPPLPLLQSQRKCVDCGDVLQSSVPPGRWLCWVCDEFTK